MSILSSIFGDANSRTIGKLKPVIDKINSLEAKFESFSSEELKNQTKEFKKRLAKGETLDDILPETLAAVREASKRTLGQRHYDVQLVGGIVLHQGKIAEMKTGEGKTLVATLTAYLNTLTEKGVHVVTVNDYLSRRDTVWMGQIYYTLGLSVACLNHEVAYIYDPTVKKPSQEEEMDKERDTTGAFRVVHEFLRKVSRREAYQADITYGTNNEFGFDYLRDNMVYDLNDIVQVKEHNFAIVDEIDSILIDEARTPLIISAPDVESTGLYEIFAKAIPRLIENEDYNVDEKLKAVSITEKGIEKIEKLLNIKNIYEEGGARQVHHMEQALRAQVLFHKDKDYVIKDGEVMIVDEFTGRLMPGRRWSDGLHQAIEAKEGVYIQKESRTYATITFQNYFRLYKKLSGMTGTAQTSAEEFHKVYNLEVVTIPTNKPLVRKDLIDRIYKTEAGKIKAVAREIKERHQTGQPVLVGTVSIEKNEILSAHLAREGVPHKLLNAKNHEQEAEIIAQAGKLGSVTVATNLAGRGVDIILGGNPPPLEEAKKVRETGGLFVIGTERHEARRIDNQLRGRTGRQGDPGSSQFFISAEDELVRIFGGDRLKNLMDRLGVAEDEPIENSFVSRAIEQAQSKIEGNNFDARKYVLEYDDVMNKQRKTTYELRKQVLNSLDASDIVKNYIFLVVDSLVDFHAPSNSPEWNIEDINQGFQSIIPTAKGINSEIEDISKSGDPEKLREFLKNIVNSAYAQREAELGGETMRFLEKNLLLRVIDELWTDQLEEMEHLRDSVRLRAYGQRDPLVEYKIESQKIFANLQFSIASQVANMILKIGPVNNQNNERPMSVAVSGSRDIGTDAGTSGRSSNPDQQKSKGIGRNDPCWCGSGKKYKKCHGS